MPRAFRIIDLYYDLLFVVNDPLSVCDFSTWIVGFRHMGGNVLRYGTEQCRINTVVDERRFERERAFRVAGCGRKRRKIAREHRSRWNETSYVCGILTG